MEIKLKPKSQVQLPAEAPELSLEEAEVEIEPEGVQTESNLFETMTQVAASSSITINTAKGDYLKTTFAASSSILGLSPDKRKKVIDDLKEFVNDNTTTQLAQLISAKANKKL